MERRRLDPADLPNITNETDASVFASFNFGEDLNGSDTALAKAIDCINDIPEDAGYTFHLLEVRCQLTVNTPLTLPGNTSLALMGGEGRGITIMDGGAILDSEVEIITFEGYPPAQLTVQSGGTLTGTLSVTGSIEECLVVEDGATVECQLFQRDNQKEPYRPVNREAEIDGQFYETLEDALNDAQADGGEVFLLRDVTVEGNMSIPQGVRLHTQGSYLTVSGTLTVNGLFFAQDSTIISANTLVITSELNRMSAFHIMDDAALNITGVITLDGELFIDGNGSITADKIVMSERAFYYHGITVNEIGSWDIPTHPTIDAEDFSRVNCALNFPDLGNDNAAVDAMIRATIEAVQNNNSYGNYYLELRNNYTLAAGETLTLPDNVTLLVRDSSDNWELEEQTGYLITIAGTLTGGKLDFSNSGFEGFENHTSLIITNGGTVSCNQYWLEGDDKLVVENGGKLIVPDFDETANDGGWIYLVDGMNLVINEGGTMTCSGILRIWPGSTLTVNGTLDLAGDAHAGYQGDIDGAGSITGTGTLQNRGGQLAITNIGTDIKQDTYIPEP